MKNRIEILALTMAAAFMLASGSAAMSTKTDERSRSTKSETKRAEDKKPPETVQSVKPVETSKVNDRVTFVTRAQYKDDATLLDISDQRNGELRSSTALTGEEINWQVISGGGNLATSTGFQLFSVVGQTAVGYSAGINSLLYHGFLQQSGCCQGSRGNIDNDPNDLVDIADLTFLIDHLFINFPPLVCPEEGNVDGDLAGTVDIADLTFLIDHLFINFPPLPACGASSSPGQLAISSATALVSASYENNVTTIIVSSQVALRGLQLELRGDGFSDPVNLLSEKLDIFSGEDDGVLVVGLVDSDGPEVIQSGRVEVIRLEGKYEIESAQASDLNHNSLQFSVNSEPVVTLPKSFSLDQNYPNPFNPTTEIGFTLPVASDVRLDIYNILGQKVITLLDERRDAGEQSVVWNAGSVASGVYFYKLEASGFAQTRKMVLLK